MYGDKNKNAQPIRVEKHQIRVGDTVRLSRLRETFEKESNEQGSWTEEIFKVSGIKKLGLNRPMYILEDLNGRRLAGAAYKEEIQVITYSSQGLFIVEKVVSTRHRGGKKQYLVRWRNYSPDFDSWVDANDLKTY